MVRITRLVVPPALVAMAVVVGSSAPAHGTPFSCTFQQITDTDDPSASANSDPVISSNGSRIAFETTQNHTGANLDGNREIVIYDFFIDDFMRVSSTTGGGFANHSPAINETGSQVVWVTNRQFGSANADMNSEIVRWTKPGPFALTFMVSDTVAPVSNGQPTTDDAGDDIVYSSGSGGHFELLHFRRDGSVTSPLTETPTGANIQPRMNRSGSHVVFASNAGLDGVEPTGRFGVFLRSLEQDDVRPVSKGVSEGDNLFPVLSEDVERIVFSSTGDLPAAPGDDAPRLVMAQPLGPGVSALTTGPTGSSGVSDIAIDDYATRVAFVSDGDHVGSNPDGSKEIFIRDFSPVGERVRQITSSDADSSDVDINASGRLIAFASRADIAGGNPDGGSEIFLASCGFPKPPRTCAGFFVTVEMKRGDLPTTGRDVIRGTHDDDVVSGGPGDDWFCGLNGQDVFDGGGGDDWAHGGDGDDTLRGGPGDDTLLGAARNDRLFGGAGTDTCRGNNGTDVADRCETVAGVP